MMKRYNMLGTDIGIVINANNALEDMEDSMAVIVPRFQIGARWFDDIVANNAAREK